MISPTFAWALVNGDAMLLATAEGHAHIYGSQEQATAALLTAALPTDAAVTMVAVVSGEEEDSW